MSYIMYIVSWSAHHCAMSSSCARANDWYHATLLAHALLWLRESELHLGVVKDCCVAALINYYRFGVCCALLVQYYCCVFCLQFVVMLLCRVCDNTLCLLVCCNRWWLRFDVMLIKNYDKCCFDAVLITYNKCLAGLLQCGDKL